MNNGNLRKIDRFILDPEKKILWVSGEPVKIQPKEVELLCVLTENPGEVVTRDELLNRVWADSIVEENNLSRHVFELRKIFKAHGVPAETIQTVPRRGYRFVPPKTAEGSGTFVVERRRISETVIEEIEDAKNSRRVWSTITGNPVWTLTLIGLLSLVAAGTYFYSQSVSASQKIRRIAVLPLLAIGDESEKAMGLGFADSLIAEIGELEDISVISINAVTRIAGNETDPLEVGRKLDVDAVMSGSLQKTSGRIRITLRLIRVADGKQMWADSFDEPEGQIFFLQDMIASSTRKTLALQPSIRTESNHPTESLEAYDLYLQGQYLFRLRETSRAGARFKRAVEIDPNFAEAWSALGAVYAMGDSMPEADDVAKKALELNPDLSEGHAVRGFISMFLNWNWKEAEQSLNRAVKLNPNNLEARHWRGTLYTILGRNDDAVAELRKALELDPMSANILADLGYVYLTAGDLGRAEETLLRSRAIEPRYSDRSLIYLYRLLGREDSAFRVLADSRCRASANAQCADSFRNSFRKGGFKDIATRDLEESQQILKRDGTQAGTVSSQLYWIAAKQAELGNGQAAVMSLKQSLDSKRSFEVGNFTLPYLASDPNFSSLRGDPGFSELLRRIGVR